MNLRQLQRTKMHKSMSDSLPSFGRLIFLALFIFVVSHFPDARAAEQGIARPSTPGTISLLAGSTRGPGYADGRGAQAQFGLAAGEEYGISPKGIVIDKKGNLFLVDTPNQTIRKISVNGDVTTFAGKAGQIGSADGVGENARFRDPTGIAIDSKNNLYVTDTSNYTIRKITPNGTVTTIAGKSNAYGWADGRGADAQFRRPMGIAVNSSDELLIADAANVCIRKIDKDGVVTTIAGTPQKDGHVDGIASQAKFNFPTDLVIDRKGNLFVADNIISTIRKIDSKGIVSSISLKGTSEENELIELRYAFTPAVISIDRNDNLFLSEGTLIAKISTTGWISLFVGQDKYGYVDGIGRKAMFELPGHLAFDQKGNAFVADSYRVRRISRNGVVTTVAGQSLEHTPIDGKGEKARFRQIEEMIGDKNGNLYIVSLEDTSIRKVDRHGNVSTIDLLRKPISSSDEQSSLAPSSSSGLSTLALDPNGNLFIGDSGDRLIRKLDTEGTLNVFAGKKGVKHDRDGSLQDATFGEFGKMVFDDVGNLYIASNNTIRKISTDQIVSTFAGDTYDVSAIVQPTSTFPSEATDIEQRKQKIKKDGIRQQARFLDIQSIAFDRKSGGLIVVDDIWLRRVSAEGVVSTIGKFAQYSRNSAPMRWLITYLPSDAISDADGNIYFFWRGTIQKLSTNGELITVAGEFGFKAIRFGSPGGIGRSPRSLVWLDKNTLAFGSGGAVLKVTVDSK